MADQDPPLVVDMGSHTFKVGFEGEEEPREVIPSLVGTQFVTHNKGGSNTIVSGFDKDIFLAGEAVAKQGICHLQWFMRRGGNVRDLDTWSEYMHYIYYNSLRIAPEERPIYMIDREFPKTNVRTKMAEIQFEKFSVPKIYFTSSTFPILYSTGETKGLAIDMGFGATNVSPVYEGRLLYAPTQTINNAGRDVGKALKMMLGSEDIGFDPSSSSGKYWLDQIQQKVGYVSLTPENEPRVNEHVSFSLPGNTTINIPGRARYFPFEQLFKPSLYSKRDLLTIPGLVRKVVKNCPFAIKGEILSNIVLAGGLASTPGMLERVSQEVKAVCGESTVAQPPNSKYAAWEGGSIECSLQTFNRWITKTQYEEMGPLAVHQLCDSTGGMIYNTVGLDSPCTPLSTI